MQNAKKWIIVYSDYKPTMRHADSIFGVTMEERGVTKIVAIEFEDAVKATAGMDGNQDDFAMEA